jgi:hypothetical protein
MYSWWTYEDGIECEVEEKLRWGTMWVDDAMDIDENPGNESSEDSDDDEDNTAEVER